MSPRLDFFQVLDFALSRKRSQAIFLTQRFEMENDKNENDNEEEWVYLKYFGIFILFAVSLPLVLLGIYGMDDGWGVLGQPVEGEAMMLTGNILALAALAVVLWTEWPLGE
jgi:hypothetical protein